jgi:AcrR family transcriptional regulator
VKRPTVPKVTDAPAPEPGRWRELAVSRSVGPAREAAESRVQSFIQAALDLLSEPDGGELTVQRVVDRSGLSLRSFYNHFAGKYELLLAVFEEGIRSTASHLAAEVEAAGRDPIGRLETFVTEYYGMCRTGVPRADRSRVPGRSMGTFAHQLLFDHPEEAAHAFVPLVSLLRQLLDDAASVGGIQAALDHDQVAGMLLQAIMFNAFATTITGATTDELPGRGALFWNVVLHGLTGVVEEG